MMGRVTYIVVTSTRTVVVDFVAVTCTKLVAVEPGTVTVTVATAETVAGVIPKHSHADEMLEIEERGLSLARQTKVVSSTNFRGRRSVSTTTVLRVVSSVFVEVS
jgi:hypothetical protein